MKGLKVFALMLCIVTLGLTTSCSKENQDLIIGNWRIVDGTSYYTDSYGEQHDNGVDVGIGIGYGEDGDYFVAGSLRGKWERVNDETVRIQRTGSSEWQEEKILSLTEEFLKISYVDVWEGRTYNVTEIMKRQ
ncbi:MAG: hypothetical protein J6V98_07825 [Bacteroidales bacterium]|nr:hypothetical protein [Bacteroidales bacterium]